MLDTCINDATYEGAVVPSVSIDNMLNQRQAVIAKVGTALAMLCEAKKLAGAAHIGFPRIKLESNRYISESMLDSDRIAKTIETITKEIDSSAWQYLMAESGLRTLMDAKAREDWDRGIHEGKFPELTAPNVEATFQQLYGARGDMFDRGVIRCFKNLSWNYKTNQPFKFGKRIVIRCLRYSVTPGRNGSGTSLGSTNYRTVDLLDDLSRALSVLDGKPEADHRNGWHSRLNYFAKTTDPDAADEYLSVRCFRNGNGHITFKRPDLVAKMNAILAKHYPGALAFDKHEQRRAA